MTDKTKDVPEVSKKEGGDEKAKKEVTAAPKGVSSKAWICKPSDLSPRIFEAS